MEGRHLGILREEFGVQGAHVSLLSEFEPERGEPDIEDPMGLAPSAFVQCYERIQQCVRHYLDSGRDWTPR
jgi:hypothetical protein